MTDAFESTARRLLKSLGYPQVPVIVTPNPVIYLTEPEIQERVTTLLDRIVASFEAGVSSRGTHD